MKTGYFHLKKDGDEVLAFENGSRQLSFRGASPAEVVYLVMNMTDGAALTTDGISEDDVRRGRAFYETARRRRTMPPGSG